MNLLELTVDFVSMDSDNLFNYTTLTFTGNTRENCWLEYFRFLEDYPELQPIEDSMKEG